MGWACQSRIPASGLVNRPIVDSHGGSLTGSVWPVMSERNEHHESLAVRLKKHVERSWRTLADLAEDHPIVTELASELARGSPQASEVLAQLRQLVSVTHMRQLAGLLQVEPCSVVVAGPVNAGKSTLLNVLAGATLAEVGAMPGTTTEPCAHDVLGFRMIDTPGADEVAGEERKQAALAEVEHAAVTVVLLDASRGVTAADRGVFDLVAAAVRHGIGGRDEAACSPLDLLEQGKVIVALNKMDMCPRDERAAVRRRAAADLGITPAHVVPISALKRSGLDRLVKRMVDAAPGMVEALVEVMPTYADDLAGQLIHRYSLAAATLALAPIPGPDVLPLTALQLALVIRLARIYGHRLTWKRSREVLPAVAAGLGWRELFRQVARIVPISGWAVSSGIAYAGTYTTGRAAQHLLRTGRKPTPEQIARWRADARE